MHVVLEGGAGPRIVGMAAHARNARVVKRVGATVIAASDLGKLDPSTPVLVVTEEVTLTPALFEQLSPLRGVQRVGAPGTRGSLVYGPAGQLAQAPDEVSAHVRGGSFFDVATADDRAATTTALLRSTQKPTDGIVSRNLNRYISRFFSRFFLNWGLKADHASYISFGVGIACAVLCAMTGWWSMALAGFLFQFASAFDGVDGEMARVTLSESPRGAWLDTAVDNMTYLLCLIGVVIGWLREGVGPGGVAVAIGVVVVLPLTLIVLMRFVNRYGPDGSLVFVDRTIARAADDTGRVSLVIARTLFYALRRDVFSLLFFFISLIGSRAAVPAAVAVGLGVALVTFTLHSRQLINAAVALRRDLGLPPVDEKGPSGIRPAPRT